MGYGCYKIRLPGYIIKGELYYYTTYIIERIIITFVSFSFYIWGIFVCLYPMWFRRFCISRGYQDSFSCLEWTNTYLSRTGKVTRSRKLFFCKPFLNLRPHYFNKLLLEIISDNIRLFIKDYNIAFFYSRYHISDPNFRVVVQSYSITFSNFKL